MEEHIYVSSARSEGTPATILRVHADDGDLYFTVHLTLEDKEVQTTADHLRNYKLGSTRVWTARIYAARAKTARKHDDDNPTLARGLSTDPLRWGKAVEVEFSGLKLNDVYDEIKRGEVPVGCQILNMMIILKIKHSAAM